MKKNGLKRQLAKIGKRGTHKRRAKERHMDTLLREIEETGVGYSALRTRDTEDLGRRGRKTPNKGRDEIRTEGIFSGARGGFGFVSVPGGEGDIFLPASKIGGAIDGDLVEVVYHKYHTYSGEEKTEGRVTKIIKVGRELIIGELARARGSHRYGARRPEFVLLPDDGRVSITPRVRDAGGALPGDKVAVRLTRRGEYPEGDVVLVLGDPYSCEANYEAILLECGIPIDFSEDELREADAAASEPVTADGRIDRRGDIIFTIDGAGAKDLDDAVSLRKTRDGWLLGVHIADVSHYVKEKTALDRAAIARGTSVYFVDRVVPMLPPSLSNGACSLNVGEDKYTLSAMIRLSSEGEIIDTRIERSIINSRVRGVYSEVNEIFEGTADKALLLKYKSVLNSLNRMRELYGILASRAEARGMLLLEMPESVIQLDDNGDPCEIYAATRGVAERLIEQFMLTANEAVARLLRTQGIPAVYRVHAAPPADKLRDFISYASNLGLDISGIDPDSPSASRLSSLIFEAGECGITTPVSYSLLRSMAKAEYSDKPLGHFGLALADYCHFTSPIRRLSDLATHRIINAVLLGDKRSVQYNSYARRASAAATDTEIRALSAERRIENLYKALFMRQHIGEIFSATVSSVASFGMFVMADNTCEGLVPLESLAGYFAYDEKNLSIRSRDTVYRVGDRVSVRLDDADVSDGRLTFSVVDEEN